MGRNRSKAWWEMLKRISEAKWSSILPGLKSKVYIYIYISPGSFLEQDGLGVAIARLAMSGDERGKNRNGQMIVTKFRAYAITIWDIRSRPGMVENSPRRGLRNPARCAKSQIVAGGVGTCSLTAH